MKTIPYDDYNGRIGDDFVGAVTSTFAHSALRNGWKIIEVYEDEKERDED